MPNEFSSTVSSQDPAPRGVRYLDGGRPDRVFNLEEPKVLLSSSTQGASDISFVPGYIRLTTVIALSTMASASDPALAQALTSDGLNAGSRKYAVAASSVENRDLLSLQRAIDAEPVEDGVTHPAQKLLEEFVERVHASYLAKALFQGRVNSADFLRLLGRIDSVPTDARIALVRGALASADVEIRDAAVQASECWDDPELAHLLRAHSEPVAWLAQYVARVADDIAG